MTDPVKKLKTYFHRTPGASFFMPDGKSLTFSADDGHYTTDDEKVQFELDKIANIPTSHVYTKEPVAGVEEAEVISEIVQSATVASDAVHKTPPGTKTVPMPVPPAVKPTLANSSAAASAATTDKLAAAKAAVSASGKPPVVTK